LIDSFSDTLHTCDQYTCTFTFRLTLRNSYYLRWDSSVWILVSVLIDALESFFHYCVLDSCKTNSAFFSIRQW